jgi:Rrf2 family transcriptional regulator, nitric oxide-sensitive transcriptional repressor
MRLTTFTDYTLRVLIFLGVKYRLDENALSNIGEISLAYDISENHLMKAVHQLALTDWVISVRGRNGGIRLNLAPDKIIIGEVVRRMEDNFFMAECFDKANNQCVITSCCQLKHVLASALAAYMAQLDRATLDDLLPKQAALSKNLGVKQVVPVAAINARRASAK